MQKKWRKIKLIIKKLILCKAHGVRENAKNKQTKIKTARREMSYHQQD